MKSWLTKFKISAALDEAKPLPRSLSQAIQGSEELRRFTASTRAVEHALRETKPQPALPPGLHRSIMRAVENSAAPPPAHDWTFLLRWLAAPGFAVVLTLALWTAMRRPAPAADTAPLTTLSTTLEFGSDMPSTLAPALVSPLSDELAHLNQDLTNTAAFLLSSVP